MADQTSSAPASQDSSTASLSKTRILLAVLAMLALAGLAAAIAVPLANKARARRQEETPMEQARRILQEVPMVDGHNNLPSRLRMDANQLLQTVDLRQDLRVIYDVTENDIPRLRQGLSSAHMWAAKMTCDSQYRDAVRRGFTQVDLIKRMVRMYPADFMLVTEADGIMEAFEQNKIGSIITLESGHAIDSSLALLRMFYDLGVRGLTLTWQCSTPWADYDGETRNPNPPHNGLTEFGKLVVKEMNRLGMIVDLSHVSDKVMHDALDISEAPLHFSHSGAYAICNTTRNVKDEVLLKMKEKDGILMIPFIDDFIGCRSNTDTDRVKLSEKEKDGILMIPFIDGFIGCRANTNTDRVQLSEVAGQKYYHYTMGGWIGSLRLRQEPDRCRLPGYRLGVRLLHKVTIATYMIELCQEPDRCRLPGYRLGVRLLHKNYVRNLIGADYLGIGSGFDCCTRDLFAEGLEDASTYPALFAELLRRGWTEEELQKVAGLNLIRVWRQVEAVRDRLAAEGMTEIEDLIPEEDTVDDTCRTWVD
ncbi:DPEP1 [Branchiostoma lanceolatum]|uniref:Dipeptidase n=1 Tax=Branchiostoma lanceolatum TaxID=7740 RepID=A0A8J9ZL03_BRALA|nr:DPEP1 [Branchiostoma lanceolatum]